MGDSFVCIGGVLNLVIVVSEQLVDLLVGLEICCFKVECIGFFVDVVGIVVIVFDIVGLCECVILNEVYDVMVIYSDEQIVIFSLCDGLMLLDYVVL